MRSDSAPAVMRRSEAIWELHRGGAFTLVKAACAAAMSLAKDAIGATVCRTLTDAVGAEELEAVIYFVAMAGAVCFASCPLHMPFFDTL